MGKIGSVITSANTQHGGLESTILATQIVLLHHGMLIAGLPYTNKGISMIDAVVGGGPYGAATVCGSDGSRMPSEQELENARFQGRHVTALGKAMVLGKAAAQTV